MATTIQLRRGTAAAHSTFTGALGEITFDTTNKTLRAHDASVVGGTRLAVYDEVTDRLQVANANITFETKAVALAANTAQNNLINDRLQVANATATFSTLTQLGNTNAYIAAQSARIDLVNTNLTSTNTAIRALVSDRLQVANASSLFVNVTGDSMSGALAMGTNKITGLGDPTLAQDAATKTYVDTEVAGIVNSAPEALNTLNELAAALGDDANFATTTAQTLGTKAANTYVNQTFETKAVALTSNTAQNVLINDRFQIANARVEFLRSANTTVTNDASSITTTMNAVDLNDEALVNPAGFLTINIGGTNYKLPFYS